MGIYGNNTPTPYNDYHGKNRQIEYNMPQYPQYPMPTSGMCIAGFVCSLVLFGILGLVFSIIGIKECNEQGYNGKGLAIAGLVISIIKVISIVLLLTAFSSCICYPLRTYKFW